MRRIMLWFLTTVSTVVLLFGYRTSTSSALPPMTDTGGATLASGTTGAAPSTTTPSTTTPSGTGYSGSVTGSAVDTRWGPVQVRVTLENGRITAVDVIAQPDENGKDREINAEAVPELVSETLSAQSAGIDMVSGATYTSTGYVQSLQSALDQAGVA